MKCELCSSGERGRQHRLCLSCREAMARLSAIANSPVGLAAVEPGEKQTVTGTMYVPIITLIPNYDWL